MGKNQINYREIIGFLPEYIDGYGNGTRLILEEGEGLYDKSARSFLGRMSRYYFLDLDEVKKYYGRILGIKHLVPLPFDDRVFIPIKYRRPRLKNDGAMGYLDMDWIESLVQEGEGTRIGLLDGRTYWAQGSLATVKKHYRHGYIVQRFTGRKEREEASYPATKGDIDLLIREVARIKDRLK